MIHTVKTKGEIGKDTYGGIIKMGAAAIGSILAGLYLFLTELSWSQESINRIDKNYGWPIQ